MSSVKRMTKLAHRIGVTRAGEVVEVVRYGLNDWRLHIAGKPSSKRGWQYVKACAKGASICLPNR